MHLLVHVHLLAPACTCSPECTRLLLHIFAHPCMHLLAPVYTCLPLHDPDHPCVHLLTPACTCLLALLAFGYFHTCHDIPRIFPSSSIASSHLPSPFPCPSSFILLSELIMQSSMQVECFHYQIVPEILPVNGLSMKLSTSQLTLEMC